MTREHPDATRYRKALFAILSEQERLKADLASRAVRCPSCESLNVAAWADDEHYKAPPNTTDFHCGECGNDFNWGAT